MRIGLYGGTFDPPHLGHLRLAEAAKEQLELDEIVFLPASRNPLKQARPTASGKQRMEMIQLMIGDRQGMSVSDIEVSRRGPSYTIDTIDEFCAVQPADYWFLLGADSLKSLPEWKSPERMLKLCRLGVVVRPPLNPSEVVSRLPDYARSKVDIVQMAPTDVSSTDLRARIATRQPVAPYIDAAVLRYIQQNKLYTS